MEKTQIKNELIEKAMMFGAKVQELELNNKITFTADYAWDNEMPTLFNQSLKAYNTTTSIGKYNYYSEFIQEFLENKEKEVKQNENN